jgi:mannan endo-1,4-beta-mannosidase
MPAWNGEVCGVRMSWQAGRRVASAGIALAVLTAGGSAASAATAAQGTAAQAAAMTAVGGRAAAIHPAGTRAARSRPRPRLGVYAKGIPRSYRPVQKFGAAVGKRPGFVLFYTGIGEPFPAKFAAQAHAHGAVPLDQIEPTGVSIGGIAKGRDDAYLRSYADEIRSYRHRVIIGFAHEMNGSWYPWGWTHVSPRTWVRAWRHVVQVFRRQHADNVTWLWTVSRVLSQGPLRRYWPGARYVNWVGIDGYYTIAQDNFRNVFVRTMRVIRTFTHDPVLVSESAIGQRAGQARKVHNLLTGVLRHHLRGLVWFDVHQHGALSKQDWRLEGHRRALAAFRRAVRRFR